MIALITVVFRPTSLSRFKNITRKNIQLMTISNVLQGKTQVSRHPLWNALQCNSEKAASNKTFISILPKNMKINHALNQRVQGVNFSHQKWNTPDI
jgi:hypothetical protein